jgi:ATP-dependent protease HslVU (ClpYQ) peptidase subunit
MTCIAGVVSDGKVYIGGDSAGVNADGHLQLRKDPKVFLTGDYLIGVSGSWRVCQKLRFTEFTSPPEHIDPFNFAVSIFMDELRDLFKDTPERDFELLVGFQGRLFHIYGLSQVSEEIADYEACGSGAQVARGAMYAMDLHSEHLDPDMRVNAALEAAERFCSGVRGPFNILEI